MHELLSVSDRVLAWLGAILPALNFVMLIVLMLVLRRIARQSSEVGKRARD